MISDSNVRVRAIGAAFLASLAIVAACGGGSDDESADICQTEIVGSTSPVTGALTMTGSFYANESVILSYNDNGVTRTASGTPASDRTSFTLTGLPSGDRTYSISISCEAGREDNGSRTFSVK